MTPFTDWQLAFVIAAFIVGMIVGALIAATARWLGDCDEQRETLEREQRDGHGRKGYGRGDQ